MTGGNRLKGMFTFYGVTKPIAQCLCHVAWLGGMGYNSLSRFYGVTKLIAPLHAAWLGRID
jgi:hypothetical protein